eukprot:CAMPEP_0197836234 /NCGR_PEP_ID=MMETSP1437-20131217/28326_1 /TAXON_ID=49252 ORGANISM="Eucampia antarctica, Strain CCMP1452" /NCGR_SAMPLE_ID=MMETSP1437 /ASSEMBLY_ACC=CAM_ASM_001096 /LENGTH=58 /DNA_ID=CAMNT_0043442251 /DNA_START=158 /DNA_END=331 /DNA_ORIENTATION=-
MTGYVYLLDGLGNVRWAGSGSPDDEGQEVQNLILLAKTLTPVHNTSATKKNPQKGKRD